MAFQPQATRSLRRIQVRTPGNRLKVHYIKRKPTITKCSNCKNELKGIPRERPSVFRNLPYSQKTVSRPYGGNLCSKCSREKIIEKFKNIKEFPLDIGQVCVKTAGKESGLICVIVDKIDDKFVLIDGQVKRRKCNILHLKTLDNKIEIKQNEQSETIKKELKALGHEIREKKKKSSDKRQSEELLNKKEIIIEKQKIIESQKEKPRAVKKKAETKTRKTKGVKK